MRATRTRLPVELPNIDLRRAGHFQSRQAQRGLRPDVLNLIVAWARPVHGAGAVFLTLRSFDVPPSLRRLELIERARDWVVVQTRDGTLITCYRRRNASAWVRRMKAARFDLSDATA